MFALMLCTFVGCFNCSGGLVEIYGCGSRVAGVAMLRYGILFGFGLFSSIFVFYSGGEWF